MEAKSTIVEVTVLSGGAVKSAAAVKKGAPIPDISTPEAVKRLLVGAKSLTYMDPTRGTSGKFFDEVVLPSAKGRKSFMQRGF